MESKCHNILIANLLLFKKYMIKVFFYGPHFKIWVFSSSIEI